MSVREYIGARYVPVFIGDWDNTKTYEPLSIVQYQGDTFTSRQFVPIGIAIDNDVYWAETGNFNAQVEQYRQEVQALATDVETLKEYTVGDIRRYGAKEKDATLDWSQIIADCAEESDSIYFPAGEWYITETLDFSNRAFVTVHGDMAKLTIPNGYTLTDLMLYDAPRVSDTPMPVSTISGFFFNCNGNCQNALHIICGNTNISNCKFMDYTLYGIDSTGALGKKISNCEFGDDLAQYQDTQIAIGITTDNQVSDCKFFGQYICIECGSHNIIANNLFYPGDDNVERCIAIANNSTTQRIQDVVITNNEFDTMPISFKNFRSGMIEDNIFYWNSKLGGIFPYTIFYFDTAFAGFGEHQIDTLSFSSNTVKNGAATTRIVHTFLVGSEINNMLARYVSRDNSLSANSIEQLRNFRIGFGIVGAAHPFSTIVNPVIFEPVPNVTSGTFGFMFKVTGLGNAKGQLYAQNNGSWIMDSPHLSWFSSETRNILKLNLTQSILACNIEYYAINDIQTTSYFPFEGRIVDATTFSNETASYTGSPIIHNMNTVS